MTMKERFMGWRDWAVLALLLAIPVAEGVLLLRGNRGGGGGSE